MNYNNKNELYNTTQIKLHLMVLLTESINLKESKTNFKIQKVDKNSYIFFHWILDQLHLVQHSWIPSAKRTPNADFLHYIIANKYGITDTSTCPHEVLREEAVQLLVDSIVHWMQVAKSLSEPYEPLVIVPLISLLHTLTCFSKDKR